MEEITPIEPVMNGDIKTPRIVPGLRDLAITGGPGRPKGMVNKFTALKHDLLDTWKRYGKDFFVWIFKNGTKADKKWAAERIISILPREAVLDIDVTSGPKVVIVVKEREPDKIETIDVNQEQPNNPPPEKDGPVT